MQPPETPEGRKPKRIKTDTRVCTMAATDPYVLHLDHINAIVFKNQDFYLEVFKELDIEHGTLVLFLQLTIIVSYENEVRPVPRARMVHYIAQYVANCHKSKKAVTRCDLFYASVSAFWLACKMEEVEPRDIYDMKNIARTLAKLSKQCDPDISRRKLLAKEKEVLNILGFELYKSHPVHYIMFYFEQTDVAKDKLDNVIFRAEIAITTNPALLQYSPKLLAAALLSLYACDGCWNTDLLGYKSADYASVKNDILATMNDKKANMLIEVKQLLEDSSC